MPKTAFLRTTICFESDGELFEVCTDSDYVYLERTQTGGKIIKINIQDWFEIVTYIEKQLK